MPDFSFAAHTLVKNGMPFIDLVLRQVVPFANRCLITISEKSDDGTLEVLKKLKKEFPNKVFLNFENVKSPGKLTKERQKLIEMTYEDWILFLDDDDYWSRETIKEIMERFKEDVDGFSVNPYQVIDERHHDASWNNRYFLKWFKKQPGLHYRYPYPRDLVYLREKLLYWKKNPRTPRINTKFFHLSYIKYSSWREDWGKTKEHKHKIGKPIPIPEEEMKNIWEIYEQFNKYTRH